jgi:hypothetical protein
VYGNSLWFNTTKGRVFKTTDKGLTFTVSTVGNAITDVQRLTFSNADTGYACMHVNSNKGFKIAKSIDGGLTWTPLQNNSTVNNTTIFGSDITAIPNTGYLISVGADATINGSTYSLDGGQTWYLLEDTSLSLKRTCVRFISATTGWAGTFNLNATTQGISKYSGFTIGIQQLENMQAEFSIYPNPIQTEASLLITGFTQERAQLECMSITGQLVWSQNLTIPSPVFNTTIDFSTLPQGVYFLRLHTQAKSCVHKFIKY